MNPLYTKVISELIRSRPVPPVTCFRAASNFYDEIELFFWGGEEEEILKASELFL